MSGHNLIFLVRRRFPQIPFIALSGAIGPEQRATLSEVADDAVFNKAELSISDICKKASELIHTASQKEWKPQVPRRRSERIPERIPIEVSGTTAFGTPFTEKTTTIMISAFGGSFSSGHELLPDQFVRIRNLPNGIEEDFRVVTLPNLVFGTRREYGVELLNPNSQIWGIRFVTPPEAEDASALMQCSECKKLSLISLGAGEFKVFLRMGAISRHCESCDITTRWQTGETQSDVSAGEGGRPPAATLPQEEKRKHPRHRLAMRASVRRPNGEAERVQVLDVSKSGLRFQSRRAYELGEVLRFALPSDSKEEIQGKIVWKRSADVGQFYGVQYIG